MLKQSLEQKQIQKLSPQQIMTAKLIELPIQSLEQRVRQEIEENPVLEEDDSKERSENSREVSLSDYKEDDPIPAYRLRSDNYSKYDERPRRETFSVQESFPQITISSPTSNSCPCSPVMSPSPTLIPPLSNKTSALSPPPPYVKVSAASLNGIKYIMDVAK